MNRSRANSILLVVTLIVSSFAFVIPTFSPTVSAWTPEAGTSVWNATANGDANVAENWNPVGVPSEGQNIVFNDTSVYWCNWNLVETLGDFSMTTGYTGKVTQNSSFGCENFIHTNGTFEGYYLNLATCYGNWTHNGSGTLVTSKLRLRMMGDGGVLTWKDNVQFFGLQISADVTVTASTGTIITNIPGTSFLTIDADKTLTISDDIPGFKLHIYYAPTFTYSNLGTIAGPGTYTLWPYYNDPTITLGTITAPFDCYIGAGESADRTLYLGENTNIGSDFILRSSHATNTIEFNHGSNYTLEVSGNMTIDDSAIMTQGTGTWTFQSQFSQVGDDSEFHQGAAIIQNGDWLITDGVFTGNRDYMECMGDFLQLGGLITNDTLSLQILGADKELVSTCIFHDVHAVGDGLSITDAKQIIIEELSSMDITHSGVTFSGPANVMVEAPNGDYVGFVREGISHFGPGEYAVMAIHRSTDNGASWNFEAVIKNVTDRDVRNYAVGVTSTGRIIIIYGIYDCDNATWDAVAQLMYSDDNGSTWEGNITIPIPTIDGVTFIAGSPYGGVRIIGSDKIGFCYYGRSATHGHNRFAYSDDDGLTWSHVLMTATRAVYDFATETDFVYVGDDKLIALSRRDGSGYSYTYTSLDNGLTWTLRGELNVQGAKPPTLVTLPDNRGRTWVFAIFAYQTIYQSFGLADNIIERGSYGWTKPITWDVEQPGKYATFIMNGSFGQIMINDETGWYTSLNYITNISFTFTTDFYPTIANNLTIDTDMSAHTYSNLTVSNQVENYGTLFQHDYSLNISGSSETPIIGYGTFDGAIYLDGATAISYTVEISLPMGELHTDRDTTIHISQNQYIRLSPHIETQINISIDSLYQWTIELADPLVSITYTLGGAGSAYGYQIYQDGTVISVGVGPEFSFTAIGGGEFQVEIWYGHAVSSLVILTVNMIGLGIMLGVLGTLVVPLARDIQKGKNIKPERVTRDLIRTVIFIVVGCVMWIVLHSIAIG